MTTILTAVTAFAAVVGIVMLLRRPLWAFLLIMVLFALEQLLQSYFGIFIAQPRLFNYSVALLALLAVGLRILRREPVASGMNNPVTYLIYAQFLLWAVAGFYSPESESAWQSFLVSYPYMILLLGVLPLLILDLRELRSVFVGTMVVGSIIALLIIFNPKTTFHGGRLMMNLWLTGNRQDQYGNPLATAEVGGMVALIAALIAPVRRQALFTALRILAFTVGMALAIGSGSRGQVIATAMVGVAFYPMARKLNSARNFILSAAGLLLLVGGLYVTFRLFVGEINEKRWDTTQMVSDVNRRFDMARDFITAWSDNPDAWAFGLGTNAWNAVCGGYNENYVHNVAVEILCEHGLVGATIFVLSCLFVMRDGLRLWRLHSQDRAMRSVVALMLAIGAFGMLNALKQGNMAFAAPFYWMLVMSKIARHEHLVTETERAWDESEAEPGSEEEAAEEDYRAGAGGYALVR